MSNARQIVFSLVLALTVVSVANAQRGRGFRAVSPVELAAVESVQNEINLKGDQKQAANDIRQTWRDGLRAAFESRGQGDANEVVREKMQKLSEEADAKLKELLQETQSTRLTEIFVQVNGVRAIGHSDVAKALSITDEQNEQLREVNRQSTASIREALQDLQGASREERRELMAKSRDEADKQVLGILSDEQKEKLEAMKGDAFEFDRSQLRRRRN